MPRITGNPEVFGGKPTGRGRGLAVEHVIAAGDTVEALVAAYPWLEPDAVRACVLYARKDARLKDALARGFEDVAKGRVIRLETDDDIDEFFSKL